MSMLPRDPPGSSDDRAGNTHGCGCKDDPPSQQKNAPSPRDIQRRVAALEREYLAARRDHVAIHLYLSELNKELARIDAELIALAKSVGISVRKRSGESSADFHQRVRDKIAEGKRAFDAEVVEYVRSVEALGISIKRWPAQTQLELIEEVRVAIGPFIMSGLNAFEHAVLASSTPSAEQRALISEGRRAYFAAARKVGEVYAEALLEQMTCALIHEAKATG